MGVGGSTKVYHLDAFLDIGAMLVFDLDVKIARMPKWAENLPSIASRIGGSYRSKC